MAIEAHTVSASGQYESQMPFCFEMYSVCHTTATRQETDNVINQILKNQCGRFSEISILEKGGG